MLPALLTGGRMAMQALPYISAAIGGLPGLMKGDLKQAATGAGLGYLGGRFAKPTLARGAGRVVEAAPGLASMAGSKMPIGKALQLGALGGTALATGVGAPLIGGLASAAAQPIASLATQGGQAVSKALGLGSQTTGVGMPKLPSIPGYSGAGLTPADISVYGPPGALEYFDPTGSIQNQLRFENQQQMQELRNQLRLAPHTEAYQQRAREAELLRQAKSKQLATQLETDAVMRAQGQLGAQAMGQTFQQGINALGTFQPQYF